MASSDSSKTEEVEKVEEDEHATDESAKNDSESEPKDEEETSPVVKATDAAKPAAAQTGLASRLASALRIKNNGKNDERDEVLHQLDAAAYRTDENIDYEFPSLDLLLAGDSVHLEEHEKEVRLKAKSWKKPSQFRLQSQSCRNRNRPGHRPVRSRARSRPAPFEDHQPGRRPGDRLARAQRPHRRADSGQKHRRH